MSRKTIVITGVTKGIGRSLLDHFNKADSLVAGCGRSVTEIEKLKKAFPNFIFEAVDVSDTQAVQKWADAVVTQLGIPHLVINNASIINKPANLWEVSSSEFQSVLNTNIFGYWNIIHAFTPKMLPEKTGVIVNISSGWGKYGDALFGPYCASKFAVEGMTQSLSRELPKGMAAIALSPGVVNTQMLKSAMPNIANSALSPDEWAKQAVPFLLNLSSKDNGKSLEYP